MKTLILALSLVVSFSSIASANNGKVSKLLCIGTAEEPGAPLDIFHLTQNSNGKYTAAIAKGVSDRAAALLDLSGDLNCEFADNDPLLFHCSLNGASISGVKITREQIPAQGLSPRELTEYQVNISGDEFEKVLGTPLFTLDFLFTSNCEVE